MHDDSEALHRLVDELPDEQAELARVWLEDLRDAADENGPPLDRGQSEASSGRAATTGKPRTGLSPAQGYANTIAVL